jgi:hypothetical protein
MRISTNAKILGSVHQRNLFANTAVTVHFSGYVRYLKNFDTTLLRFFATIIAIEKLLKSKGSFL